MLDYDVVSDDKVTNFCHEQLFVVRIIHVIEHVNILFIRISRSKQRNKLFVSSFSKAAYKTH
jgi:hypothetical protein